MAWLLLLLPLVLGWLVLTLINTWRMRAVERQWEQALHEQDRWDPS